MVWTSWLPGVHPADGLVLACEEHLTPVPVPAAGQHQLCSQSIPLVDSAATGRQGQIAGGPRLPLWLGREMGDVLQHSQVQGDARGEEQPRVRVYDARRKTRKNRRRERYRSHGLEKPEAKFTVRESSRQGNGHAESDTQKFSLPRSAHLRKTLQAICPPAPRVWGTGLVPLAGRNLESWILNLVMWFPSVQ